MARDSINRKLRKAVYEDISASVGFIPEAPELDPYIEPGESEYPHKYDKHYRDTKKRVLDPKREKYVSHRNLGEIHPGYELHRHVVTTHRYGAKHDDPVVHSHRYTIVHKKTKDVAGEIDATAGKIDKKTGEHRPGTGKGLKIDWVGVHSDHSSKKVGKSLAIAAYKHLHNKGHSIKSDTRQSFGGAHVWDKLRHDPDVGHHVKFHDRLSHDKKPKPAHGLPYAGIWQEHPSGQETTLVLHAKSRQRKKAVTEDIELIPVHRDTHPEKPRKATDVHKDYGSKTYSSDRVVKRKKTVKEDIEIANVLNKPHGGYHRDFAKMVEGRGMKPKRSGRIAKGYTLYTSKDKDDPKTETHHIVHDATNHVAGEVWTRSHGDDHHVISTDIHGDHTKKKIGKSLAVLAYKHLARKKGSLTSSALQSPGGASIWNRLRKDPKMKGRVFHSSKSGEVPAHDLSDKKIWASEITKIERSKGTPQYLPPSSRHADEHGRVMGSRLVIRHPKKA